MSYNSFLKHLDKDKLEKLKKTELDKIQKIHLNAIDDANDALERGYDNIRAYKGEVADIEGDISEFTVLFDKLRGYDDTIEAGIDNLGEMYGLVGRRMDELRKGANDLGLKVEDIPVYNELFKLMEELEEFSQQLEDYLAEIQEYIK